jgi:transcriptional regulator with XRE-family HTH domain
MEKPHERLDRFMNDRRLQLPKIGGKTVKWFQVAERAGITVTTLTALRKGQNVPTEDTKRGVEHALAWEPGSVDAILDGGDPTVREKRVVLGTATTTGEARAVAVGTVTTEEDRLRRIEELFEQSERAAAEGRALLEELRRERREGA